MTQPIPLHKRDEFLSSSLSSLPKEKSNKKYRKSRIQDEINGLIGHRSNVIYDKFSSIQKNSRWMNFRVSNNLNIEELKENFSRFQVINIVVFLAEIRHLSNYNLKVKRRRGMVQLSAKTIFSKFTTLGKEYIRVLEKLINLGYIVRDESYQVGAKCKSYALGEKLRDSEWKNIDFGNYIMSILPDLDPDAPQSFKYFQLWNRFNYYCQQHQDIPDQWLKSLCEEMMELNKDLTVEVSEELNSEIKTQASSAFAKYVAEVAKSKGKKKINWSLAQIEEAYWDTVESINSDLSWIKVHHKGYRFGTNRIYSSITNAPKAIRKKFRYNDQPLVSVDIRACQVALLASFYEPGDEEEKAKFVDTLSKKDIYTLISKDTGLSRDDAKGAMFKAVMFGSNHLSTGPIYDEFQKNFPILAKRIWDKKYKDGYKSVSYLMQTTEALVMIQGVLQELVMDKKIPAWSIHDSILCQRGNVDLVKETIVRHFSEIMGFAPVLKID